MESSEIQQETLYKNLKKLLKDAKSTTVATALEGLIAIETVDKYGDTGKSGAISGNLIPETKPIITIEDETEKYDATLIRPTSRFKAELT